MQKDRKEKRNSVKKIKIFKTVILLLSLITIVFSLCACGKQDAINCLKDCLYDPFSLKISSVEHRSSPEFDIYRIRFYAKNYDGVYRGRWCVYVYFDNMYPDLGWRVSDLGSFGYSEYKEELSGTGKEIWNLLE